MTLDKVQKWFEHVPPSEVDLPLLILDRVAYTPRATLDEVARGTAVGQKLQLLVELGKIGSANVQELELAKLRLIEVLKKKDPNKPLLATLQLPGRAYTTAELIEQIQQGTKIGQQLVQNEVTHMKRIVQGK